MDLQIVKKENAIHISFVGDQPDGNYVINLPELVNNIRGIELNQGSLVEKDIERGKITVSSEIKGVSIQLENY